MGIDVCDKHQQEKSLLSKQQENFYLKNENHPSEIYQLHDQHNLNRQRLHNRLKRDGVDGVDQRKFCDQKC